MILTKTITFIIYISPYAACCLYKYKLFCVFGDFTEWHIRFAHGNYVYLNLLATFRIKFFKLSLFCFCSQFGEEYYGIGTYGRCSRSIYGLSHPFIFIHTHTDTHTTNTHPHTPHITHITHTHTHTRINTNHLFTL